MSSEQRDPIYGEYEVLEDDKQDAWRRATLFEEPMIRYIKYNQILTKGFLEISEKIRHFETREDDVWIASQIKSGSTWMGELTWCLLNNLDYETAYKNNLDVRMTYLEINSTILECQKSLVPTDVIGIADGNKSPRLIKTHLSFDMLPKKVIQNKNKIIYMLRNPRDVCISMYNHHRIFYNYQGTLEEHVDQFLSGNCGYYTPHDVNIIGYHKNRNLPHILIMTYEEMKKDLGGVIDKVINFLGLPLLDKDEKSGLIEHLSFEKMRENPSVNREEGSKIFVRNGKFINKGKVGSWKTSFSPEMIKRFEDWEKEKFEAVGLKFTYEL